MKHKNVEVGQHVIIKRSTSAVWATAASHIGEEFTVLAVEPLSYTGDGTVLVQGVDNDVVTFWCNHRDLKRVKEEAPKPAERPFKVGDKVRVIANPEDLFPVGTIGTVTSDDGAKDELPFRVEAEDDYWYYHERDLELYVEESAPVVPEIGALFVVTGRTTLAHCFDVGTVVRCAEAPMRAGGNCRYEDTDGTRQFVSLSDLKPLSLADIQAALGKQEELPWPWPKGTPVALTPAGKEHVEWYLRRIGLPLDTPLVLGSAGSAVPPIETVAGQYICYVEDTHVTRK